MRKAERLFQILTLLRSRRNYVTAQQLAHTLAVSERTIYRDIQALSLSGIPIEAETGVGYKLKNTFSLPPLMFDENEVEALLLGVRMVESWSNNKMATAASSALAKIHAVLPEKLHQSAVQQPEWVIVPKFSPQQTEQFSEKISTAIKNFKITTLDYSDVHGSQSKRNIWPLGLIYWGKTWTIVAWCTKRNDYRLFRLDRINSLTVTDSQFTTTDNINLQHYIRIQTEKYGEC
ncbi:YafY family transcriptional regulator [Colwellia sp. D2M02]|uniref:helix-turn-helix transcriptional regulator n=1 Tax=Colwellia sp. D2M02 TaxID=2841562 RepID=UPI001C08D0F9|nr:YafY family protein [Colwellia sp. D2M02]MBU2894519.1 YafY family transcriptional regulator [Colwellia sp. D2M02]